MLLAGSELAKQLLRGLGRCSGFRLQQPPSCLPPSCSKVFADANGVIASPGPVGAEIGGSEIAVPGSKAVKKEVLGHPHFKSPTQVDGSAPGVFDPNSVEGPSVQVLGDIPAEEKSGLSPQHESTKGAPAKRSNFQNAGKHVSRKRITRRALATIIASVRRAEVGIDLIVGRSNFELCISPKRIFGQEEAFLSSFWGLSLESQARTGHNEYQCSFFHRFSPFNDSDRGCARRDVKCVY
jgi:hypothetical protein